VSLHEKINRDLAKPENEPLFWLLGRALMEGKDNFLVDAILEGRVLVLTHWNKSIAAFRSALVNPEDAQLKISREFKLAQTERVERDGTIRDLYAEILSVLTLAQLGYSQFRALLQQVQPTPDYEAIYKDKQVGIEVKNLREPDDLIRVIAERHWNDLVRRLPQRYSFPVHIQHSHQGWIPESARSRLRTLLDQLPDRTDSVVDETLEDGITIKIIRGDHGRVADPKFDCEVLAQSITPHAYGDAGLVIQSPITPADFQFDATDYRQFFLKVLRVVTQATLKFFSRHSTPYAHHLLAMRWETASPMIDLSYIGRTKGIIEALFSQIGLQLEIMIFFKDTFQETAGRDRTYPDPSAREC
jgi:hypothetical protein